MENLQFQIDQLRKDKIIYAIESCALTLVCSMILIVVLLFVPKSVQLPIILLLLILSTGYHAYMSVGNMRRLRKIKRLEKQLQKSI